MPATLATKCPGCGAGYKLKDASAAGRKMKCRKCETIFIIKPAGAKAAARRSSPQAPPKDDVDEFGDFDDADYPDLSTRSRPKPKPKTKPRSQSKSGTDGKQKTRKKPKRRKKAESSSGGVTIITIAGGVVVLIALVVGAVIFLKPGPKERIKPPESYAKFQHPVNNLFTCEYPSNWEEEHGGRAGSVIWAKFRKGDALINIRQKASGGALGDIASAFSTGNEPEDEAPVARLHDEPLVKNQVLDEFSDYSEQPARTMKSNMGDARVSQFSATGSWGSKISGYRVTILGGGGKQLHAVCSCSEEDWEVCKEIFERVIASIQ